MTSVRRRNRRETQWLEVPRVRISNEEILADLLYPARSSWALQPRRRGRRR
jgi:hypothetical protein